MFAIPTQVGISHRVVATLVAVAVVLASIGFYSINEANAANFTNVSNLISDSAPGAAPSHTISFTIPDGGAINATGTISITFPTGAGEFTNVNTIPSVTTTVAAASDPATGFSAGASSISFGGIEAEPGEEVVVAIPAGFINNPTATGSYEIVIERDGNVDVGRTIVAIHETVLVTAIVQPTFDFAIFGTATGTIVNGATTTGQSFVDRIPYGVLQADVLEDLAQRLTVETNARNGFRVTVETDGHFRSSTGAIIDPFDDGVEVTSPGTPWTSPDVDINSELTWGHWGVMPDDFDLTGGAYAPNQFFAASTTPRLVFDHDDPANGSEPGVGEAYVMYRVEITALQEAADDYQTTLTYIATPTF
jgi:hypothetical protein